MNSVRKLDPLDLLTLTVLAAGLLLTAAVFSRLPVTMPTHFGVDGRADGWMPRAVGAWLSPALAVVITALVRFGARLLRAGWRRRLEASPVRALGLVVACVLLAVHALTLRAALSPDQRLGYSIWGLLGAFFVVLGLLMPRTRRNPWIGVRTAWSLTSDENWARTHRVAGYSMTIGGLVAVMAGLVGSPVVALVALVASAVLPAVWSWYIGRRDPDHSPLSG